MKQKIYLRMCLLALITCALTFLAATAVSYRTALIRMETDTLRQATIAAAGYREVDAADVDAYLDAVGQSDASRVTRISPDGAVLYDSHADPATMENHLDRPEVQEALSGGEGGSTRVSATLGEQNYYAAIRLCDGTVLRFSNTTDIVTGDLTRALPPMLIIIALVLGLALLLARQLTTHLVAPINSLNLEQPLENNIYEEFAPLLGKIHTQNAQIEQQLALMRRSQSEFMAITQNMSEGLVVLDDRLSILSANEAAIRLLGAQARDYTGDSLLILSRAPAVHDAARAAVQGHRETVEQTGANGRHLELFLNPVTVESETRGCVLLILDVSERFTAERSRREFTANVSHELKTPLTSISGYAEMIALGIAQPADVRAFAEKIQAEAGRLITLVNDIIKLSQLDEGAAGQLPAEQVDLLALAQETLDRLRPAAAERAVTLSCAGAKAMVSGVRQMLHEALFNLCENAIKYNRTDGSVSVTVTPEADGHARVVIADTGIGIAREEQDRIFERFYRVDKSHSKEVGGTGLGLAIVKHICETHHARLTLASTPGEGTAFTILF